MKKNAVQVMGVDELKAIAVALVTAVRKGTTRTPGCGVYRDVFGI